MTREEALNKAINIVSYFEANFAKSKEAREDLENIIEVLEQEPCEDCISRQAALDTFCLSEKSRKYGGDHSGYDTIMLYEVQDALEALPSVNPQKTKTGHWVRDTITDLYHCSICRSICHQDPKSKDDYCRYCGARMVEPQESEVQNADSN